MELLRTCLQDLRYAVRNLLRSRGFTAVAAITLTIGIGANTAIFSIIDTILLRPLPFRNPGQLVRLYETEAAPGNYPFAGPDFVDWKAQNKSFQDMALFSWPGDMNLSGEGRPDHVQAVPTEANFFALLGVNPIIRPHLVAGEDQPGKDQVAVLSYGLWREHFAGDPGMVGRTIALNSKKYTIVGVMPASFRFPVQTTQMWIPLDMDGKGLGKRGSHWANAIGRMKPGVTLETGAGGSEDDRRASAKRHIRIPTTKWARRPYAAARRTGGRFPRFSADDALGGGAGVADRLRQRSESAALKSGGAAEGNGGAQRAGRGAGAAGAAVADRKPAAVAVRAAQSVAGGVGRGRAVLARQKLWLCRSSISSRSTARSWPSRSRWR